MSAVTSPVMRHLCSLDGPQTISRFKRPRSLSESVRLIQLKGGCASGVSDCDIGRMNSSPESIGLNLGQSLHHVDRRLAQDWAQRTMPLRVRSQLQALPRSPEIASDLDGHRTRIGYAHACRMKGG